MQGTFLWRLGVLVRWTTQIVSVLLLGLFGFIAVGELLADLGQTPACLAGIEVLMFLALGVMLLGILLAFWRVLLGCSLILAGYIWFTLMDQDFNLTNPFIVFPAVVILYAISFWLCQKGSETAEAA